jgi:hypothetical protein
MRSVAFFYSKEANVRTFSYILQRIRAPERLELLRLCDDTLSEKQQVHSASIRKNSQFQKASVVAHLSGTPTAALKADTSFDDISILARCSVAHKDTFPYDNSFEHTIKRKPGHSATRNLKKLLSAVLRIYNVSGFPS